MNKIKILCIGDSLTLPRTNDVQYEETWFYKIKNKFQSHDFFPLFKRGITTDILVQWGGEPSLISDYPPGSDCLEHFKPNIVILQLGIVDCAPRLLKKGIETKLVRYLPKTIADVYIKSVKKIRGRNQNNTYVSASKFEQNIMTYFNRCQKQSVKQCIVIKIGTPSEEMVQKNPDIVKNVQKYNAIYDKVEKIFSFVKCIDPLNSLKTNDSIFIDGYHPNSLGNKYVFEELESEIKKWLI